MKTRPSFALIAPLRAILSKWCTTSSVVTVICLDLMHYCRLFSLKQPPFHASSYFTGQHIQSWRWRGHSNLNCQHCPWHQCSRPGNSHLQQNWNRPWNWEQLQFPHHHEWLSDWYHKSTLYVIGEECFFPSFLGTVALCAGCNVYPAWAAVLIGALSGPLFIVCNYLLIRCKVSFLKVPSISSQWKETTSYPMINHARWRSYLFICEIPDATQPFPPIACQKCQNA